MKSQQQHFLVGRTAENLELRIVIEFSGNTARPHYHITEILFNAGRANQHPFHSVRFRVQRHVHRELSAA